MYSGSKAAMPPAAAATAAPAAPKTEVKKKKQDKFPCPPVDDAKAKLKLFLDYPRAAGTFFTAMWQVCRLLMWWRVRGHYPMPNLTPWSLSVFCAPVGGVPARPPCAYGAAAGRARSARRPRREPDQENRDAAGHAGGVATDHARRRPAGRPRPRRKGSYVACDASYTCQALSGDFPRPLSGLALPWALSSTHNDSIQCHPFLTCCFRVVNTGVGGRRGDPESPAQPHARPDGRGHGGGGPDGGRGRSHAGRGGGRGRRRGIVRSRGRGVYPERPHIQISPQASHFCHRLDAHSFALLCTVYGVRVCRRRRSRRRKVAKTRRPRPPRRRRRCLRRSSASWSLSSKSLRTRPQRYRQ